MTKTNVINVFDFDLPDTPKITELRDKIWDQLFRLYHQFILQEEILILLDNYIHFLHPKTVTEILKKDSVKIMIFIESQLEQNNYSHCYFVQEYLFFLERHQISFNQELGDYFTNETYALYQVLSTDRRKKHNYDLSSIQEYEKQQQQKLEIFFNNYNFSDYTKLFEGGLKIYEEKNRINNDNFYSLNTIVDVLIILSNRDSELYIKVLKYYLELGNQLKLYNFQLVNRLLEIVGVKKTYEFLKQPNYHLKTRWLLGFYYCLPEEEIQSIYIEELYQLFEVSQCTEELRIFDFLLKYQKYDDNVIIRIIEIVLTKNTDSLIHMNFLQNLFYYKSELHIFVFSYLLKDNLALLKKAYFTGLKINSYIDDDLEIFKKFIDADNNFIIEYIDWLYDNHRSAYFADHRDFSFLWEENDYEQTFTKIIEHIYEIRKLFSDIFFNSWKNLFKLSCDSELQKRQEIWLTNLIKKRSNDFDFIYIVADCISCLSEQKRCQFIALFIENNKNFEDFQRLHIELYTWSVERIEYFQSLLPLLNTVDYLEHRQYIEQYIQSFREYQEDAKKREFFIG